MFLSFGIPCDVMLFSKALFSCIIILSIILIMPSVFADSWYVGKELKQGDYFSYYVCWVDWHNCAPLQINFWVKNQTSDGNGWNLEFLAVDGSTIQKGIVTIETITPDPTYSDPNISNYVNVFRNTIIWLDNFSSKNSPTDLNSPSWSPLSGRYSMTPYPATIKQEQVTVLAGKFNTWVINWHMGMDSKIWLDPNLAFPVKGQVYTFGVSHPTLSYFFELVRAGNSQTSPTDQFLQVGTQPVDPTIFPEKYVQNETDSFTSTIPEFPFAILVLLVSIMSILIFYRMKFSFRI